MKKLSPGQKLHTFFVRATRRDWLKRAAYFALISAGIAITAFLIVHQWYNSNLRAVDSTSEQDVIVVIEPGSNASQIGEQLFDAGIIKNGTVFAWYVGREDLRQSLQAGTYSLSPSQTTPEVAQIIAEGLVDAEHVTILPGQRLDEIVVWLQESGFAGQNVSAALAETYKHSILSEKPSKSSLEGYIFPDTYEINQTTTVQGLLERSFEAFEQNITTDLRKAIKKQGLTFHEAVILASIVQKESSNPETQKTIAQVFLKRLKEDIPLGADPTFKYAAALAGIDDLNQAISIDSPYNTRQVVGLPPGPIGNFNISALEAVAYPDDTDFLYFVSSPGEDGNEGKTYFSKTIQEHERLTEEYCGELCEL